MKIFLTNSPFQYFHTTAFFHPDWGALNLAQLAAMVDMPDNQIKILDNWHFWFKSDEIMKTIKEFNPDFVGISNSTDGDTPSVGEIGAKIKKMFPKIVLVSGGQAATVNHKYLLEQGFDFIVMGEGEYTFRELIERLKKKENYFKDIKGLAYFDGEQLIKTEERPFLKNLDELPMPARKYQKRLKSIYFPGRYSSEIETARGCPYGCDYCSITAFYKRTLRKKSNKRIMEELRDIRYNIGARQVYFVDDSFGINVEEYKELFEMMIDENLDLKWFTQIRADTIANNPEMIELAAKSGMFCGLIGFESYNDKVLNKINKSSSKEINIRASEILKRNKIIVFGVHMFGIPGQTARDYQETYKYGRRNSDIFRLAMFSPIPGTPIFECYKKEGKIAAYSTRELPYAYDIIDENRKRKKFKILYFYYWFRHTLSPFTFLNMIFEKLRYIR